MQILLLPVSLIYGLSVWLRSRWYAWGLLKRVEFAIPVICVGNLSIGGTGKSPHIEYLIRLLSPHIQVATLSRGYGRSSKGFKWVYASGNSLQTGDEPLQFARKFPELPVAVAESRVVGIISMLKDRPDIQTVLLDDAFQHLAVKPYLNILLTEYSRPYFKDFLLPSGRLRDLPTARKRADLTIVSKSPATVSHQDRAAWRQRLRQGSEHPILFTRYRYERPYFLLDHEISVILDERIDVLLVSAIAHTDYLMSYLEAHTGDLSTMNFEDHHYFSNYEMGQIQRVFENFGSDNKIILTTEKDATRLALHRDFIIEAKLPIFILPVEVEFLDDDAEIFDSYIKSMLLKFES